jgi:hypothetical protein
MDHLATYRNRLCGPPPWLSQSEREDPNPVCVDEFAAFDAPTNTAKT